MRNVKYAGIQMQCSRSVEENIAKADKMVREAAANGAQIILLPELFEFHVELLEIHDVCLRESFSEFLCKSSRSNLYHMLSVFCT